MELPLLLIIALFVIAYRTNNGENVYKFFSGKVADAYNKYSPYSFKSVNERTKELGFEYKPKDYARQCTILGIFAAIVSYLYFYSILWSIVYVVVAIAFVPYLAYLTTQRKYSEY